MARRDTATDVDFVNVERIIAHEYFHNWTGDRVTCRDWFQLTLKEGLTVFRDQQFTADMHSEPVKRIGDVAFIRDAQFAEDAGPLAHPIRPDRYIEINNFYTGTVYQKGAEVIRMLHTLIGEESFQAGMRLYFERFDGQAVTCEDFVRCMADASGRDLGQFMRWYAQAGTPELKVRRAYDPARQALTLEISQTTPATPGQPEKLPFHIPIRMGLVGADGAAQALQLEGENEPKGTERVLELTEADAALHLPRPGDGAGPVAAARLLGPGQAGCRLQRRRPRRPDGARRGCVHALGRRSAPGQQRAPGAWSATMPRAGRPAPLDPRLVAAFAANLDRAARGSRPSPPARCRCPAAAISASRWP